MQTSSAVVSPVVIATFLAYLATVFLIGYYAYRRTRDATDYFLGGRSLSPWVAAISAGASDMSGWLLIGLPGYAYVAGLEAIWIAVGLALGIAASWLLVARPLRVFSAALDDALTLPSYLQRRFQQRTPWLGVVSAVFILLFFLLYVSSGLIAGGKLFNTVFQVPYSVAVWVGVLAIVSYTLFGGFLAVSWTDVVQGLLMTAALMIVPLVVSGQLGGVDAGVAALADKNPHLLDPWTDAGGDPLGAIAIISLLGWGLAYFGQPHILARFKAVRSAREIPRAAAFGIGWTVLVFTGAIVVGLTGAVYFEPTLDDGERVFMLLVEALFHPVVAGILLAAILAAIMSTADSQLLVCSAALVEDLFTLVKKEQASAAQAVVLGRWSVSVIAICAALFAMDPDSRVLEVVAYAWAGLGAAFGPALLLSLYWRRMNWQGAAAGIIVGGSTVPIWRQLSGGWFGLYELVPGFFLSLLAVVGVTLATPAPAPAVTRKYDDLKARLRAAG
ncbi:sodium/proline symporter PutP [Exilibacterium tricleocarpae]|uniref:Sodium/proline symporter n=1 Tax=Exilibacterium tricleocarpae TaxID=2591008 RepID=A0A545U3Q2_9GAMM|nr:sodium/proline symporter PutP [Exilibacterium tricleocarpae]TQV84117.1 sodium/proline symporter PutP [Exilibacterium tricleocarpae]